MVTMFGRNMRLLQILGLEIESGETMGEFKRRAQSALMPSLLDFIPVYEEYLYKESAPGKAETECMQKANEELKAYIKTFGLKKRIRLFWSMFRG